MFHRRWVKRTGLVLLGLLAAQSRCYADTLITNVKGYSVIEQDITTFAAVSFENDVITGVYQTTPTDKTFDSVIDGKGATLLPGLIDAHGHVLNYGYALNQVILNGAESESESAARVEAFIQSHQGDQWIKGRGWNQEL